MEKCERKELDVKRYRSMISDGLGLSSEGVTLILNAYDALKAENSKLRAALEKIENKTIWNNNSLEQDFHEANEIAREALASGWEGK